MSRHMLPLQDANRKGVAFADTATLLFEGIARVLDAQHAIVLQYYGQQYMVPTVEVLQASDIF